MRRNQRIMFHGANNARDRTLCARSASMRRPRSMHVRTRTSARAPDKIEAVRGLRHSGAFSYAFPCVPVRSVHILNF